MGRIHHSLPFAFTTFAAYSVGHAMPVELRARYVPVVGDDEKPKDIPVDDFDVLLRAGITHSLESFRLVFLDDAISRSTLSEFTTLTYSIQCSTDECERVRQRLFPRGVSIDLTSDRTEKVIIESEQLVGDAHVETITATFRFEFKESVLCARELELREKEGKEISDWPSVAQDVLGVKLGLNTGDKSKKKQAISKGIASDSLSKLLSPAQLNALSILSRRALASDGENVYYSFCPEVLGQIDWAKLAKAGDVESLKKLQRTKLVALLQAAMAKTDAREIVPSDDRTSLFVEHRMQFSMIRELSQMFRLEEVESDDSWRPLLGHVSQDSTIRITVTDREACRRSPSACQELIDYYIQPSILSKDAEGKDKESEVEYESFGTSWTLKAALSDYLDKTIRIRLKYVSGDNQFLFVDQPVVVKNFGWITSFPAISEIATLINKENQGEVSGRDSEFQGSIPLSYAFEVDSDGGKHGAITFPFMIGKNTRKAPNLADWVKVFAHVSVVFPLDTAGKSDVAFGGGLAFFNTFSMSYGLGIRDGDDYIMLGISAQDLVRMFK